MSRFQSHLYCVVIVIISIIIITVWTVVQTVLTATFNSYGDRQISTPNKIDTPKLINKKIGTVDYVHERTYLYQIWYKSTHWGLLSKWVKCNKKYFLFIPFVSGSRTNQTRWWIFYTRQLKRCKITQGCAFLGSEWCPPKFLGVKPPKTEIMGAQLWLSSLNDKKFKSL